MHDQWLVNFQINFIRLSADVGPKISGPLTKGLDTDDPVGIQEPLHEKLLKLVTFK